MTELSGVKTSLAQSAAVERVQEAARRQGEIEQQAFAARLNREVDAREHRVNEGEKPEQEKLDPDGHRQEADEEKKAPARLDHVEDGKADPDEDGPGRLVDARA